MKYLKYENAKDFLYNKDKYIENYIDNMFNRCQKMFNWKNLPNTMQQKELEYMLQKNGNVFVTKVNGNLYAFNGGLGGELNEYYEPTIYTVANPYLKISKDYKIGVDGILIRNDNRLNGLLPIFAKNAVLNCECEISLNMLSIVSRIQYLISASDDKTVNNANIFINKIKNGDLSVIAENDFISNGVKLQSNNNNANVINDFINLSQYIKASAFNEIGLNAIFNMKKERLITSEITVNENAILPLVENMLYERQDGCKKINEMFNTNISVELSCIWKEQTETHELKTTTDNETTDNETTDNETVDNETTDNEPVDNETTDNEQIK